MATELETIKSAIDALENKEYITEAEGDMYVTLVAARSILEATVDINPSERAKVASGRTMHVRLGRQPLEIKLNERSHYSGQSHDEPDAKSNVSNDVVGAPTRMSYIYDTMPKIMYDKELTGILNKEIRGTDKSAADVAKFLSRVVVVPNGYKARDIKVADDVIVVDQNGNKKEIEGKNISRHPADVLADMEAVVKEMAELAGVSYEGEGYTGIQAAIDEIKKADIDSASKMKMESLDAELKNLGNQYIWSVAAAVSRLRKAGRMTKEEIYNGLEEIAGIRSIGNDRLSKVISMIVNTDINSDDEVAISHIYMGARIGKEEEAANAKGVLFRMLASVANAINLKIKATTTEVGGIAAAKSYRIVKEKGNYDVSVDGFDSSAIETAEEIASEHDVKVKSVGDEPIQQLDVYDGSDADIRKSVREICDILSDSGYTVNVRDNKSILYIGYESTLTTINDNYIGKTGRTSEDGTYTNKVNDREDNDGFSKVNEVRNVKPSDIGTNIETWNGIKGLSGEISKDFILVAANIDLFNPIITNVQCKPLGMKKDYAYEELSVFIPVGKGHVLKEDLVTSDDQMNIQGVDSLGAVSGQELFDYIIDDNMYRSYLKYISSTDKIDRSAVTAIGGTYYRKQVKSLESGVAPSDRLNYSIKAVMTQRAPDELESINESVMDISRTLRSGVVGRITKVESIDAILDVMAHPYPEKSDKVATINKETSVDRLLLPAEMGVYFATENSTKRVVDSLSTGLRADRESGKEASRLEKYPYIGDSELVTHDGLKTIVEPGIIPVVDRSGFVVLAKFSGELDPRNSQVTLEIKEIPESMGRSTFVGKAEVLKYGLHVDDASALEPGNDIGPYSYSTKVPVFGKPVKVEKPSVPHGEHLAKTEKYVQAAFAVPGMTIVTGASGSYSEFDGSDRLEIKIEDTKVEANNVKLSGAGETIIVPASEPLPVVKDESETKSPSDAFGDGTSVTAAEVIVIKDGGIYYRGLVSGSIVKIPGGLYKIPVTEWIYKSAGQDRSLSKITKAMVVGSKDKVYIGQ